VLLGLGCSPHDCSHFGVVPLIFRCFIIILFGGII
jgi:hypothetical protein